MSLVTDLLEASISDADPSNAKTFLHRWEYLIAMERIRIVEACAKIVDDYPGGGSQLVDVIKAAIAKEIRELKP